MINEFFTSIADKVRLKYNIEDSLSRQQIIEKINSWEPIQKTTAEKLLSFGNKELKIYINKTATKLNSLILLNTNLIEFICPKVKEFTGSSITSGNYWGRLKNLQKIDSMVSDSYFYYNKKLITLIIRNTEILSLDAVRYISNTKIPTIGHIYVPKALIEDYKIATNWSVYADRFRAIEDYPEITGGAQE